MGASYVTDIAGELVRYFEEPGEVVQPFDGRMHFTRKQLQETTGKSRARTSELIEAGVKYGLLDMAGVGPGPRNQVYYRRTHYQGSDTGDPAQMFYDEYVAYKHKLIPSSDDGWFTIAEYAARNGFCASTASIALNTLFKAGLAEKMVSGTKAYYRLSGGSQ